MREDNEIIYDILEKTLNLLATYLPERFFEDSKIDDIKNLMEELAGNIMVDRLED